VSTASTPHGWHQLAAEAEALPFFMVRVNRRSSRCVCVYSHCLVMIQVIKLITKIPMSCIAMVLRRTASPQCVERGDLQREGKRVSKRPDQIKALNSCCYETTTLSRVEWWRTEKALLESFPFLLLQFRGCPFNRESQSFLWVIVSYNLQRIVYQQL